MEEVIKILKEIKDSSSGIYRKFMTHNEIKLCNRLTKDGMLYKGFSDEKNSTVSFFITDRGIEYLNNSQSI